MGMIKLAVSACGPPRDAATWSGTPANLIAALEEQGCEVLAIDWSKAIPPAARVFESVSRRILLRPGVGLRTFAARRRASDYVLNVARKAGFNRILHTGSLDLPTGDTTSGEDHALFCDSTWHTATTYSGAKANRDNAVYEAAEADGYRSVNKFFPTACYVRDSLVSHYGVAAKDVLPVGTGLGRPHHFCGEKDYAGNRILMVARASFEDKGGPLLLEAFDIARRTHPDMRLTIVGSESDRRAIEAHPGVTFLGFLPEDELHRLFAEASLFAMPALYEPWGLVYLEALATKTPILGLDRCSLPEFTRDGRYGFLVSEPSPEAVGRALVEATSDPDRLRRMGLEGQRYCSLNYDWSLVAERILDGLA